MAVLVKRRTKRVLCSPNSIVLFLQLTADNDLAHDIMHVKHSIALNLVM